MPTPLSSLSPKDTKAPRVDTHTHTLFSHGQNTVREMAHAAYEKGLDIQGFSEHSPRPAAYSYQIEYREKLEKSFPMYIERVMELRNAPHSLNHPEYHIKTLLGVEVDWLEREVPFMQHVVKYAPFDYCMAGIHFLDTWGFDANKEDWDALSTKEKNVRYTQYYQTLQKMAQSNLFHILAHPDIIKIFSVEPYKDWEQSNEGQQILADSIGELQQSGIAIEISSAGLRKPCAEIYPGPVFMDLAAKARLPIAFGSDAHTRESVAYAFSQLGAYASHFGYATSVYFEEGQRKEKRFGE